MKKQNSKDVFKSFEQLKADIFPQLTLEEHNKSSSTNSSEVGACLANEAIESLLSQQKSRNS